MKRLLLLLIFTLFIGLNAQQTQLVFVFFKDKPNKAAFYGNPLSELSQKSLDRRNYLGISLNDQDAPIEQSYIQNIINLGFTVNDKSKWLNGVAVNATPAQITTLSNQSYVDHIESFVKNPNGGKMETHVNKFDRYNAEFGKINFNYGESAQQIDQINLRTLHQQGYTGQGITIAMLDTGYPTVNNGSAFARIRDAGKIKGGYNFIDKNTDIYNTGFNTHGTITLGSIVGFVQNQFVGTAPDVDVYLYVTESGPLEIPEEELYWIQGAEEADRKGVDIISASLGYGDQYDDTRYNYTYADMTGSRSFVARGAQIATEKGIIVMSANGNEAQNSWHYLLTPADNVKVFSVGAVTSSGQSSSFSSFGPNALGAIKPDASAKGSSAATVYNNGVTYVSGTSIATPIAAGGVACLLQALSKSTSRDQIRNTLRNTASLAPSYNNQMGYGILNFGNALNAYLAVSTHEANNHLSIYPNPNNGSFTINTPEDSSYQIFDMSGRLLQSGIITKGNNKVMTSLKTGIYQLSLHNKEGKIITKKIVVN